MTRTWSGEIGREGMCYKSAMETIQISALLFRNHLVYPRWRLIIKGICFIFGFLNHVQWQGLYTPNYGNEKIPIACALNLKANYSGLDEAAVMKEGDLKFWSIGLWIYKSNLEMSTAVRL
jgi:hypothetical protein